MYFKAKYSGRKILKVVALSFVRNSKGGVHLGCKKTVEKIIESFNWTNMHIWLMRLVNLRVCQRKNDVLTVLMVYRLMYLHRLASI